MKKIDFNQILVSIIVPVYNVEKYLYKCVDSIIKQSYRNIEIILIDDGSTDKSGDICDKLSLIDKRIKVFHEHNAGVSNARNTGLQKAKGNYIFFIDSDDTIDKDVILNLIKYKNEKNLVSVNHCICKKDKKKVCHYNNKRYKKDELIKEVLEGNILGVVWGYLFDKNIIKNINFDIKTSYLEDFLFLIQYLNQSKIEEISFIESNNYYNYCINLNSITSLSNNPLKKSNDFIYSLDQINIMTNYKYDKFVENKKILLLEKEMRLCKKIKDYKTIINSIHIGKYTGNVKRIKIFEKMYKEKKYIALKIYYFFRNIVKKIKNSVNCI